MDYKVTSVGHNDFSDIKFKDLLAECGIANTDYPTDPDGFEYERRIDNV